ncbi:MAG: hypothetical protein OZ921_13785 [Sorangiineae bacterium]|nr:hypothetical protein [Polyangiaceae bacterium]MEB2323578.1 hypothetical protein [Sorangiineae bacterium]
MDNQHAGRCSYCGGQAFTPLTRLSSERDPHLDYQPVGGGFFSGERSWVYGTVCLACGHVMLFVDPKGLDKLRKMGPIKAGVPPQ